MRLFLLARLVHSLVHSNPFCWALVKPNIRFLGPQNEKWQRKRAPKENGGVLEITSYKFQLQNVRFTDRQVNTKAQICV